MGQLVGLSNKNQGKLTTIQEKNVYKRTIPQPMEDKGNFFISKTGEGSIFKEKRKQDSGLKTLGSTLADIGLEAGEGITSVIENLIAKPFMRGVSNVAKTSGIIKLLPQYKELKTKFGIDLEEAVSKSLDESLDQDISKIAFGKDKEGQEKLKQSYEIAKKYANIPSFLDPTNRTIDANARQGIDESSILGEGGDAIVQGAAQSLMIGGAGAGLTKGVTGALTSAGVNVTKGVTKAVQGASTFATSGVNSFNNKLSEMHREGYDDRTSLIVAGKTGLFEGLTELIGAGIPGLNTSGAFDVVEDRLGKALTKKFNSNIGKLAVGVLKAGEEASEEFFNNFFNTVSDYILYDLDKNYTYDKENKTGNIIEDLKNQKTLEQMLYAGITAGISSGSVSISNVINKNSVIKAYAKDNNVDFNTAKKQIDEYANKYAENQRNEDAKYMDLRQEGENIALNEARKGRLQSLVERQYQENRPTIQPINQTNNLQDQRETKEIEQENKTIQEEKTENKPKNNVKQEIKQEVKNNLTNEEQKELETLKGLEETGALVENDDDYKRLRELEAKAQEIPTNIARPKEASIEQEQGQEIDDDRLKQNQMDVIKNTNPIEDDYHTGIRTIEDIKTLQETLNDSDYEGYDEFVPDLTRQDIENAIKKGTIVVYSSYPIQNGVFVTPSKMEAESYSGNGKVYSKEVPIQDVAWIEPTQGQYAKVEASQDIKSKPKQESTTQQEKPQEKAKNDVKVDDKPSRRATIKKYRELASTYLDDMSNWKDTPLLKQKMNTMKRNLRDILPEGEADILYDEYFAPISKNNATIERETKKYNEKIQKLNLSKNEAIAVQLLGEYKYNPETKLTSNQVYDFINKHKLNEDKLNKAVDTFREVYDELFGKVNEVLKENGYTPIGYKKGYFPHFTEEHGKTILGRLAEKLGWKFNSQQLPTDIAGLTDTFSPGKKWVTFAQHRTGDFTDYNALKGFDNYVRGAMQVIYHTTDIQKLRGLENEIRYQHSEKGVKEKLDAIFNNNDLDTEEKQNQIDALLQGYNNNLSNFVMNLHEYTNNLAGKKSGIDRSIEFTMGRNIYNTMNNISSRVSANMVGMNLSSALTNFIPITQAWSQISTKNLLKAMGQTITNSVRSDGFIEKSDYLTNRIDKADKLYKTGLEKVSDKAGILFDAIDSFSSQVITRGKYLDNIQKGMSEQEAMKNADEFAKDVMAGRSQGDRPTLFNSTSPITKLFTAFQLEVNNQYGYMFKDLPHDLKNQGMAKLISAFLKMFLGAWLYNKIAKELTGRKSAFSPIDIVADSIKTTQREDLSDYEKISTMVGNITDEVPFISGLLGGGRLPISSALPSVSTIVENSLNLGDEEKKDKAIKNITKELEKPLFYIALPFGGGQLKKTKDVLEMYDEKLPIAGSYTPSGNLRFEADTTPLGIAKALVFGQYSSKEAQDYVDSGFKAINSNKIQELKDLNMTTSEYRKYSQELKNAGTSNEDKIDYIANSDYTTEQKNIMANNVLKRDDFDVNEYNKCDSYEEYTYSRDNPGKYAVIKQITSFDNYSKYKEKIKNIKANSKNDKKEITKYINSLSLNPQKKLMLYKIAGGYSIKNNKDYMYDYINKLNISKKEKASLWKTLFE